jgi:hypothetical protein
MSTAMLFFILVTLVSLVFAVFVTFSILEMCLDSTIEGFKLDDRVNRWYLVDKFVAILKNN